MEPPGDYYQQFLSSISGTGIDISPSPSPQDVHPPQYGHQSAPMPLGRPSLPNSYHHFGYFSGYSDGIVYNSSGSQRGRRKSAPGFEHVKHRRTRSGCYTCRSRRVKCDEGRPICARCKKGKRDCVYPEPTVPKQREKKKGQASRRDTSPESSHDGEEGDTEQESRLDTIPDEEEQDSDVPTQSTLPSSSSARRSSTPSAAGLQRLPVRTRHGSETPSVEGNKSSSPATSTGTSCSLNPTAFPFASVGGIPDSARDDWSRLPQDVRFYLTYFCDNITHYHYSMLSDSDEFFRIILPTMALQNESLLYALASFSAYHYALGDPNGNMEHFLQYYNRGVRLLLRTLTKKEEHNVAALLTILQLATIEEYLGDWVNVMGHQKAAFEVLTRLFTPHGVMQSPLTRMPLAWYCRFDVYVGLMGEFEPTLAEEWFSASFDYFHSRAKQDPSNLGLKYEECAAKLRILSRQMSQLYGQSADNSISDEDYTVQHKHMSVALHEWKASWDPAITDSSLMVRSFPGQEMRDTGNLNALLTPDSLHGHPIFPTTILTCEWLSLVLMHESQSSSELLEAEMAVLTSHSYAMCRIFEALEQWPHTPPGAQTKLQSSLSLAALFLPQDEQHQSWMKKKFARIESLGHIFPATMRKRMAELFNDRSCLRWWLPNDEGLTPFIQAVRSFADERSATIVSAQKGSLREARHVFGGMGVRNQGSLAQIPSQQHGSFVNRPKGKGKERS